MPYFTRDELRALPDMGDYDRFSNERLDAAHDWIVAIIERECETSFIYKTATTRLSGGDDDGLFFTASYVRSVDAISVDGVAFDPDSLAGLFFEDGAVYRGDGGRWPSTTRGNITVSYTAGYSAEPPGDLKEAALRGARHWLLTMDGWTGIDERTTSMTSDYGTTTVVVADDKHPTGLPFVDATINAWAKRVRVPKVA